MKATVPPDSSFRRRPTVVRGKFCWSQENKPRQRRYVIVRCNDLNTLLERITRRAQVSIPTRGSAPSPACRRGLGWGELLPQTSRKCSPPPNLPLQAGGGAGSRLRFAISEGVRIPMPAWRRQHLRAMPLHEPPKSFPGQQWAKAGIHSEFEMDSGLRRNDDVWQLSSWRVPRRCMIVGERDSLECLSRHAASCDYTQKPDNPRCTIRPCKPAPLRLLPRCSTP
jgi:hypothetical protein